VLGLGLAFGVACASPPPEPARPKFDPVTMDPPRDPIAPARLDEAVFTSAGSRMFGIVYVAAGPGPHPTAVVLHGFPGDERNLDLAQSIRRAGWNAVFFHYRGAWGSEGRFGFGHALDDVAAVLGELREPAFAEAHRIDPGRLAVVGHSMGGFMALVTGAEQASVRCVASLAGANVGRMGSPEATAEEQRQAVAGLDAIKGPIRTPAVELAAEIGGGGARFDTTTHAAALALKPLLLVAASEDRWTPTDVHHAPLVAALHEAGATSLVDETLATDHAFSDHRIALARLVTTWLENECR